MQLKSLLLFTLIDIDRPEPVGESIIHLAQNHSDPEIRRKVKKFMDSDERMDLLPSTFRKDSK